MKYLRYAGEFEGLGTAGHGTVWRVELWQEAEQEFEVVGDLDFPAEEPLVIDWPETAKHEVMAGSAATLRIISPGDRTYTDLYQVAMNAIRMDVYRNGVLWWSGCLDPEQYEEPYQTLRGYEVTLTFTDFGSLDRKKHGLSGCVTLREVVDHALEESGIVYTHFDLSMITTEVEGVALDLTNIKVNSANFVDTDGTQNTIREVLEGVLQPLALRMIQRGGKVYIFDLNGLYTYGIEEQIWWSADRQTYSVDSVYNNAKISWDSFVDADLAFVEEPWGKPLPDGSKVWYNHDNMRVEGDARFASYPYNATTEDWNEPDNVGFTLWIKNEGEGVTISGLPKLYKFMPGLDEEESQGVAFTWYTYYYGPVNGSGGGGTEFRASLEGGWVGNRTNRLENIATGPEVTFDAIDIQAVDNPQDFMIKIRMDGLFSCDINPFHSVRAEDGAVIPDIDNIHNWFKNDANIIEIPVSVLYRSDVTGKTYVWRSKANSIGRRPIMTRFFSMGEWEEWQGYPWTNPSGFTFYESALIDGSSDDPYSTTPEGKGWVPMRTNLNPWWTYDVSNDLKKDSTGQCIPYPPHGPGRLWVEILNLSWKLRNAQRPAFVWDPAVFDINRMYAALRWALLKVPTFEVLHINGEEIDTDDTEYEGRLNPLAKDPVELSTKCGTKEGGAPFAKGAYLKPDLTQLQTVTRAGRESHPEDLLIGTLYSQYAERKIKLVGEARLGGIDTMVYTEANQGDRLFMPVAEEVDCITNTANYTIIELRPDEYTRANE